MQTQVWKYFTLKDYFYIIESISSLKDLKIDEIAVKMIELLKESSLYVETLPLIISNIKNVEVKYHQRTILPNNVINY